jgi:hypothetical protein
MADERTFPERFEERDDPSSSLPSGQPGRGGRPVPLALTLRPYRVVQRYRGDRVGWDDEYTEWANFWTLRSGDVSWPEDRRG